MDGGPWETCADAAPHRAAGRTGLPRPGLTAGLVIALVVTVVLLLVGAFDGPPSPPAAALATAGREVRALQQHDVTAAYAALCPTEWVGDPTVEPGVDRWTLALAEAGLTASRVGPIVDGGTYHGFSRQDFIYRVAGVPGMRGLGVSVIASTPGHWCVMKLWPDPPVRD